MTYLIVSASRDGCPCGECGLFYYPLLGYYCEACLTPYDLDMHKISSAEWNRRWMLYHRPQIVYEWDEPDNIDDFDVGDYVYFDSGGTMRKAPAQTNRRVIMYDAVNPGKCVKTSWRVHYAGMEKVAREPFIEYERAQT